MTQRETVLATSLLVGFLVFGAGAVAWFFVVEPINDLRTQLSDLDTEVTKRQTDLEREEKQIGDVFGINPRLSLWQQISLPPKDPEAKKKTNISPEEHKRKHLSQMQVAYERYLSELLVKNGIRSATVTPRAPDRNSAPILRGKEPLYDRLTFQVAGQGTMEALSRVLAEFHKTPLLHQVRTMAISLAQSRPGSTPAPAAGTGRGRGASTSAGQLEINLTVEALLVNGAEERKELKPETTKLAYSPRVLAEPGRDYGLLGKRNMFTGVEPPPPPAPTSPTVPQTPRRTTEERNEALQFIKLTMLSYDPDRKRWEATIYDQAKGGAETKLNTRALSEIKVMDREENVLLDAEVVHIGEKQLIFKSEGKFYRMQCGDFMFPAINEPLPDSEVKELGLAQGE